ncbi:MAG TPA: hypothetical protein VI391_06825 [Thermoanaerobaculia bacterium]
MRALKFIAGAAAGFLVWWYGTLFYDGALSFAAERVLQLDHRLCGPHLVADDRKVEVTPRDCVVPTATIPADQLTYNIILFAALFAMRFRRTWSFLASLAGLVITHVLSLALSVESTYSRLLLKTYSPMESSLWTGAEFWWRLAGMFAFVFVCWWLTGEVTTKATKRARTR